MNENGNNEKISKVFYKDAKLMLSVFLAGTGLVFWSINIFFNPVKNLEKDIALLQKDVQEIKINELTHIYNELKDNKEYHDEEAKQIREIHDDVLKIMVKLNNK
jgi:cell division protein FtsB